MLVSALFICVLMKITIIEKESKNRLIILKIVKKISDIPGEGFPKHALTKLTKLLYLPNVVNFRKVTDLFI